MWVENNIITHIVNLTPADICLQDETTSVFDKFINDWVSFTHGDSLDFMTPTGSEPLKILLVVPLFSLYK